MSRLSLFSEHTYPRSGSCTTADFGSQIASRLKTISRESDVRKVGLHEISQFLAQLNMLYSTVQGIGKFRADLLFSHQTFVKWPLVDSVFILKKNPGHAYKN